MQIKHQPLKYLDLPALRAAKTHFGFCFFQGALFTPQALDLMLFHTMNTDCFEFWHLGLIFTCTKRPCLFPWSLDGNCNCLPGLAFSIPTGNSPLNTQSSPFSLCIFSCVDPCISFSVFQEMSKLLVGWHLVQLELLCSTPSSFFLPLQKHLGFLSVLYPISQSSTDVTETVVHPTWHQTPIFRHLMWTFAARMVCS